MGFDLEQVEAVAGRSRFPNGFDLEILGSSPNRPGHAALLQIIQSDLTKLGINAVIADQDVNQVSDRLNRADINPRSTRSGAGIATLVRLPRHKVAVLVRGRRLDQHREPPVRPVAQRSGVHPRPRGAQSDLPAASATPLRPVLQQPGRVSAARLAARAVREEPCLQHG